VHSFGMNVRFSDRSFYTFRRSVFFCTRAIVICSHISNISSQLECRMAVIGGLLSRDAAGSWWSVSDDSAADGGCVSGRFQCADLDL
jgi:hypothetical protein